MKTLRAFSSVRAHLIGEGTKAERTEVSQVAIHFTEPLPVRKGLNPEVEGLRVAQKWINKRLQFLWDKGVQTRRNHTKNPLHNPKPVQSAKALTKARKAND